MNDLESRIRRAYQDESFQLPETALPTVLARRRRRLSLAAAAAAVVAVIGGATLAFAVGTLPSPLPRVNDPATDPSARTRLCDRQGVELLQDQPGLRDRDRTMPERMVSFSEGGQWLNLYLGDRVIVSCLGPVDGEDAVVELDVLPMTDPEATWYSIGIMRPLGRSIVGGQSFLVVTVPPDTERVVAQLPDGTTVPAVPAIGTHVYVAWLPAHREDGLGAVEELTLTAYTPDIVYLYEDEVLTSRKR